MEPRRLGRLIFDEIRLTRTGVLRVENAGRVFARWRWSRFFEILGTSSTHTLKSVSELKRILLVAFHYPPVSVSSGLQRTLSFSRYLPDHGWKPAVLTAHPRAYFRTSNDQLSDIPEDVVVARAQALDTSKHLSLGGRYWGGLALPDKWVSWLFGALVSGLPLIRRFQPDVIWSTYPIATAQLIGYTLSRMSGVPWVADFRDLMIEPDYPAEPRKHRAYQWIESKAMAHSRRAVFVTPGAARQYEKRYPTVDSSSLAIIPNGFDESILADLPPPAATRQGGPTRIVHSGILYPVHRNPRPLFEALVRLREKGEVSADTLQIIFRGTSHDDVIGRWIEEWRVGDLVKLEPPVGYRDALAEMRDADALLVMQAADCNDQIPAKVYEYLALGRPILALADLMGDTARFLDGIGVDSIAPLHDSERIESELRRFLGLVRAGKAPRVADDEVAKHSRRARSSQLAALLDHVVDEASRQ